VGNHSRRSRVRCRTDTGLVRVETSLDTVDQAGTRNAAEDCAEVKRIGEDTTKDRRNSARMHDEDHQRDHHIGNAHERNHETRGLLNALAAAHHADADQNCEPCADCHGGKLRVGLIPAVSLEGGLGVVGAEHIKAARIGEKQEDNENRRKTLAL